MPNLTSVRTQPLQNLPVRSRLNRSAPTASLSPSAADRLELALPARLPLPRDRILFLGLNPASDNELKALRQATGGNIEVLKGENGKIGAFNLDQAEGRTAFVQTLGLDAARSAKLTKLLDQADAFGRDELAGLARIWARAESGQSVPGRLVFSGHSDGLKLWGESGRGSLTLGEIGRLADLFPAAAAKVEDIHLSGCNTGYRSNAQFWREHFPNLRSFWGYTHTAPSSNYASPAHLKTWESATRGAVQSLSRPQLLQELKSAARSGNLAVWSRALDYQSALPGKNMGLDEIRQIVEGFRLGESRSANPQAGPLKQAYDALQTMRGEEGSQSYDDLIGKALRLRFYDTLAANFHKAYGEILKQAFSELKLPAVDFAKANRRETLQAARHFNEAFSAQRGSLSPAQIEHLEKVKTLLYHFEYVEPDFFAAEWIDPLTPAALTQARADFEKLQPLPQWPLFPGFPGLPGLWPGFGLPGLGDGFGNGLGNGFGNGLGNHLGNELNGHAGLFQGRANGLRPLNPGLFQQLHLDLTPHRN